MAYVIRRCRSKGSDPNSAKGQSRYRVYGIPTTHDKGGYDMQQRNITVASGLVAMCKGQATLCVQSAQYRTRSSEMTFLRTVLVWLSTCIPYQLNIVSDYAITQYRTNVSEIAHLVRVVCSGLNFLRTCEITFLYLKPASCENKLLILTSGNSKYSEVKRKIKVAGQTWGRKIIQL